MSGLEEVEMDIQGGEVWVDLQQGEVRVVEDFISECSPGECGGSEPREDICLGMSRGIDVGSYDGGDEDGRHKGESNVSVEEATVVRIL